MGNLLRITGYTASVLNKVTSFYLVLKKDVTDFYETQELKIKTGFFSFP